MALKKFILITPLFALLSILAGFALSTSLREKGTYVFNCTESLPQYIFRREERARDVTLKKGDFVEVCPKYSKIRNFVQIKKGITGTCDSGVKPFLKIVGAVAGDFVEINNVSGIIVNDKILKGTVALSSKIEHFNYKGYVPHRRYILYTQNPEGYDSRYFGFVDLDEIVFKLTPVF